VTVTTDGWQHRRAGRTAAALGISDIFPGRAGNGDGDDGQMTDDGDDSEDSEDRQVTPWAPAATGGANGAGGWSSAGLVVTGGMSI